LEQRVEMKAMSKHISNSMNRLHVAMPIPRDQIERPPCIPASVLQKKSEQLKAAEPNQSKKPEKLQAVIKTHAPQMVDDDWDPTVFGPDYRSEYLLASDDWKFDSIPEIIDGKNIADYIDPDILLRLEELDKEEEERELEYERTMQEYDTGLLNEEEEEQLEAISNEKKMILQEHRGRKQVIKNKPQLTRKQEPKTTEELKAHLEDLGINPTKALKRTRSASRSSSRIRERSQSTEGPDRKRQRLSSQSRERSQSQAPPKTPTSLGFKNIKQKGEAATKAKNSQKIRNRQAKKGEADRVILNLRPKHLFSGKRGIGKTQRR